MGGSRRVRNPTQSTIRDLFATQFECAEPQCHAPLVSVDSRGNRKITAEVAHIAAASPGGPRFDSTLSEEDIRGFDNLVVLCETHHKMVDSFPSDYPTESLKAWKQGALIDRTDLTLTDSEIEQVVDTVRRLEQHLELLTRLSAGPAGRAHRLRMKPFVDRLTVRFAGRSDVLKELATTSPGDIRLLIAGPGEGKSAVAAKLVDLWQQDQWPDGTRPLLIYAVVNRQEGWAGTDTYLKTVNAQLADLLDEPVPEREHLTDLEADHAELWARVTAPGGPLDPDNHVVLLVDGLDEQDTSRQPKITDLIPRSTSDKVAVVVTSRPEPDPQHRLALSRFIHHQVTSLGRLRRQDVADLLTDDLQDSVADRVFDMTKGHALYVRFVVDDLCRHGPDYLDQLDLSQLSGVQDYIRYQMDDVEQRSSELTREILKTSVAAAGPISLEDVDRFLRWRHTPEPATPLDVGTVDLAACRTAIKPIERYLTSDAVAVNHLELEHIIADYLGDEALNTTRRALTEWGTAWWKRRQPTVPATYLREHWITHLADNGDWGLAADVVTAFPTPPDPRRQRWATARHAAEGSYAGYLGDLDAVWRHADHEQWIAVSFRCALLTASIHSLSTNLHPELPALLVSVGTTSGRWRPEAALEYIRIMPDRTRQLSALLALSAVENPPWPQILDAIGTIGDDAVSAALVTEVGPRIPEPLLADILAAASGINHRMARATALLAVAPRLDEPLHTAALDAARAGIEDWLCEVLRAVTGHQSLEPLADIYAEQFELISRLDQTFSDDPAQRPETAIDEVTPLLSQDLLREILAALGTADLDSYGGFVVAVAVAELAPPSLLPELLTLCRTIGGGELLTIFLDGVQHIPRSQQEEAVEVARSIDDENSRAQALIAIAARAAEPGPIFQEALDIAKAARSDSDKVRVLIAVVQVLPESLVDQAQPPTAIATRAPQRERILQDALEAAEAAGFDRDKAELLTAIAPQLPESLVDHALRIARTIDADDDRAKALIAIAAQVPGPEPILQEALEAAEGAGFDVDKAEVLAAIAPQLPESLVDHALDIAGTIDAASRVRALEALVPHIDDPAPLISDALAAAETIGDDAERTDVLIRLAPMAPSPHELIEDILSEAREIGDDSEVAEALVSLAPHLSEALLSQTVARTRTIADEMERASALIKLARYLPVHLQGNALEITREMTDDSSRVIALTQLAPYLDERPLSEASGQARAITTLVDRARALAGIAPHLSDPEAAFDEAVATAREAGDFDALKAVAAHAPDPAPILRDAIDAAHRLTFGSVRAAAFLELCPYLADPLPAVQAALEEVRGMWLESNKAEALSAMARHLPPTLVDIALDEAREIRNDQLRSQALAALVPCFADRETVIDEALAAACSDDVERRHEALTHVAPYLSDSQWDGALATPLPEPDDYTEIGFAEVVIGLVPHMPDHFQTRALDDIRAITAPELRAPALAGLVPHIAESGPVLADALAAARAIAAPELRARTLTDLASHVAESGPVLADALAAACEIDSSSERADVLAVIGEQAASWTSGGDAYLSMLRSLARYSRAGLLSSWVALEPWTAALHDDQDLEDFAHAIAEVAHLRW